MHMKNKTLWIGILSILVVAGCGRSDLEPLSGTVNFNGEPLGSGVIRFVAVDSVGTEAAAPPTSVGIKDGRFEVPKEFGLKQGPYRITIIGYEGFPRGDLPLGLNIFPDYNTTFEFTGQGTAEFEVPRPARPVNLPPPNVEFFDPSSPRA